MAEESIYTKIRQAAEGRCGGTGIQMFVIDVREYLHQCTGCPDCEQVAPEAAEEKPDA